MSLFPLRFLRRCGSLALLVLNVFSFSPRCIFARLLFSSFPGSRSVVLGKPKAVCARLGCLSAEALGMGGFLACVSVVYCWALESDLCPVSFSRPVVFVPGVSVFSGGF